MDADQEDEGVIRVHLLLIIVFFSVVVLARSSFAQGKAGAREPQFTDYPAAVASHGKSVAPKLQTPGQRRFRTVIRDWVNKGPNFAGHYTIAEWGCGTGCEQIAVVNNQSGDVHEGPFGSLPKALVCLGGNVDEDKTGIVYRLNSSLFVVRGCPNDKGCGTYYYMWTGTQFKLLRQVPMKPVFGCEP